MKGKDSGGRFLFSPEVLRAILLFCIIGGSLALVRLSPLSTYLRPSRLEFVQKHLRVIGISAPLWFLGGGALSTALGVPRMLVSILGGMAFGAFFGLILTLGATLIGSFATFALARWLGRPLIERQEGRYVRIFERFVEENCILSVLLIRQMPMMAIFVNVVLGLCPVSISCFFVGSVIGLLPETIVFSVFGSSIREGFVWRISLGFFLLVILVLGMRMYIKRSRMVREMLRGLSREGLTGRRR